MRKRPFRRRRRPLVQEVLPPLASEEADEPMAVDAAEDSEADAVADDLKTSRRPRERLTTRWRVLLVILLLVAVGVLALTGFVGQLPADVGAQWPWLLAVIGGLGLLVGVVTAWPYGTLGGPPVLAVGLVALLDRSLADSWPMALAGALLLAFGAAVILRGLTMPRARA